MNTVAELLLDAFVGCCLVGGFYYQYRLVKFFEKRDDQ